MDISKTPSLPSMDNNGHLADPLPPLPVHVVIECPPFQHVLTDVKSAAMLFFKYSSNRYGLVKNPFRRIWHKIGNNCNPILHTMESWQKILYVMLVLYC